MKTAVITLVASLASTVVANPVAIPIDFSLVEARQDSSRPPPSYGGACQRIAQQYPALISYPNSTLYETENHLFWSETTVLSPACVFTPSNAQQIANALKVCVQTKTRFAVRGGGHTPIPGAANTNGGVLVGLDRLKQTTTGTYKGISIASIGPGLRWIDVYSWSTKQGFIVMGGRYAPVGVPGVILGGGLSYFASVTGWAADSVVQFEVVTADSRVILVNAASNADLFWALKGGAANFAIVTRIDTRTYPIGQIWGGYVNQDAAHIPDLLSAISTYVDAKSGGSLDGKSAIDATIYYNGSTKAYTTTTSLFYNGTVNNPPALRNFTKIPTLIPATTKIRSYVDFEGETAASGDRSLRELFRATSTKGVAASPKFLYDIFVQETKKLKTIEALFSFVYQPITVGALRAARALGGDPLDLDPADGPILMQIINVAWDNPADDAYINNWAANLISTIETQAKAAGLYYPFIFLNDAGPGQKPLGLYGKGKSLPKLKTTAKKYDPNGVFQTLSGNAFKLATQ
ncbi:MAG: hypothetical protein LQ351_002719 [Letrouitia transgressa]|nr:MAG: hypothetical protein LQ351_002719 [Letrouitia transgressa]